MIKSGTCMKNSCAQNISCLGGASSAPAGPTDISQNNQEAFFCVTRSKAEINMTGKICTLNEQPGSGAKFLLRS